jgi:hypothetical protein
VDECEVRVRVCTPLNANPDFRGRMRRKLCPVEDGDETRERRESRPTRHCPCYMCGGAASAELVRVSERAVRAERGSRAERQRVQSGVGSEGVHGRGRRHALTSPAKELRILWPRAHAQRDDGRK